MAQYARAPARINPLLQPKVEIIIAIAMMRAPEPLKITSAVAEATRSLLTVWIVSNGSVTRYATFARRYNPMTSAVPKASDKGILRLGFLTSPAVKVMLFHASAEKSELVCATQMATNNPKVVIAVKPPGPTS